MFFVKYHFVSNSGYYDRNVCTVGVLSQDGNGVLKHPMVLVHPYSLRSYIVCVFFYYYYSFEIVLRVCIQSYCSVPCVCSFLVL